MTTNKLGIYIHIPYCLKRCRYCDFLSYTSHNMQARAYYSVKVAEEILSKSLVYGKQYTVDSIFIGGGTPSILEKEYLEEILDAVYSRFRMESDTEITIESNPGTLSPKKHKGFLDIGINRLSMGVQSLNDEVLRYLGRIHTAEEAVKNYFDAREAGFENINIDMMFGIPGQSEKIWHEDFKKIIDMRPEHISFYSLQVEENTPIFSDVIENRVTPIDQITDRKMYHDVIDQLFASGYNHYEISNAAFPGYESRHNLKYWSMKDYLGVGLGAHSFVGGKRFCNTEILKDYLSTDRSVGVDATEQEITGADHMSEYIFLGLRKTEGISLEDFEKQYGRKFLDLYKHETENLINRGLLELKGGNLKLTALGLDLSNQVFIEYV